MSFQNRVWSIDDILSDNVAKSKQKTSVTLSDPIVRMPPKLKPEDRFPQLLSLQHFKENSKPYVQDRTLKNNTWSTNVFMQWVAFRNQQITCTTHKCPTDLLETLYPPTVVDEWLAICLF